MGDVEDAALGMDAGEGHGEGPGEQEIAEGAEVEDEDVAAGCHRRHYTPGARCLRRGREGGGFGTGGVIIGSVKADSVSLTRAGGIGWRNTHVIHPSNTVHRRPGGSATPGVCGGY